MIVCIQFIQTPARNFFPSSIKLCDGGSACVESVSKLFINSEVDAAESKQLLLEDKASREGVYINEINELKRVNNRYQLFNKGLITVIIVLLIVIIGHITFTIGVNNSNSTVRKNRTTEIQNQDLK